MTLPRFLGRLPYAPEQEPIKAFDYTENLYADDQNSFLWCNASFALAANIVKNFERRGWSPEIIGIDSGGRVDNLPIPIIYNEDGQAKIKIPVEASIGEIKDEELCRLGFIPLAHWARTDYACFFEAHSVLKPKKFDNDHLATAHSQIDSRLQYTLLVTRIVHYLKYRQLRFIGRNACAGDIQSDMESWLNTIVADQPNPSDQIVAKRPLRSYKLEVQECTEKPGYFQVFADLRPHIAMIGIDIILKLNFKIENRFS